jgi:hypothetical protein
LSFTRQPGNRPFYKMLNFAGPVKCGDLYEAFRRNSSTEPVTVNSAMTSSLPR